MTPVSQLRDQSESPDGLALEASTESRRSPLAEEPAELLVFSPKALSPAEQELLQRILKAMNFKDWELLFSAEDLKPAELTEKPTFGILFGERALRALDSEASFAMNLGKLLRQDGITWLVTHSLDGMLPPILERTIQATKKQTWAHLKDLLEVMQNA